MKISKMHVPFLAIISCLVVASMCQECPQIYLRYSQHPTFCKPRNPQCQILKSGVNSADRQKILDSHNSFRNNLANGNERQAGGLPQAANMMQMNWDNELADIAQKLAETCVYAHDDNNDRRVENFAVGQNIASTTFYCQGNPNCISQISTDWPGTIKQFYDEVPRFHKNLVDSVNFNVPEDRTYGHFTQVVWASTWRMGCGFVQYKAGSAIKQYFVCNYGPAGNTLNAAVYKRGAPCSACPTNSCCGKTCPNSDYNALCRMNSNSEAPRYPQKDAYIYYCDFSSQAGDCSMTSDGKPWKLVKALGGSYVESVLDPGTTSTMKLMNPLVYQKDATCMEIEYGSGATLMGQNVNNKAVLSLVDSSGQPTDINLPPTRKTSTMKYRISLPFFGKSIIKMKFSVPREATPQYFNIQRVSAKNGNC